MVKNMKISKILVLGLILVCAVGIVSATDISKLKMPDNYLNLGDGTYGSEVDDVEIDIYAENVNEYFKNNTDMNFTVKPGKFNNTFEYTDGINNYIGVSEMVKINNKPMAITFWTESNATVNLDKYYDALKQVNELNNLTPIDPTTANK